MPPHAFRTMCIKKPNLLRIENFSLKFVTLLLMTFRKDVKLTNLGRFAKVVILNVLTSQEVRIKGAVRVKVVDPTLFLTNYDCRKAQHEMATYRCSRRRYLNTSRLDTITYLSHPKEAKTMVSVIEHQ